MTDFCSRCSLQSSELAASVDSSGRTICLWILPAGRFVWETLERTAVLQFSLGSVIVLVSLVGMIVWGAFSAVLSES